MDTRAFQGREFTMTDRVFQELAETLRNQTQGGGPGVEVLVGVTASGKSTYARQRAKRGAMVVCLDDLVSGLHPGRDHPYESSLSEIYQGMERAIAVHALMAGRRVVVDRTNLTRAARDRWLELAEQMRVPIVAVRFPMEDPLVHARRRFNSDPPKPPPSRLGTNRPRPCPPGGEVTPDDSLRLRENRWVGVGCRLAL